MQKSLFGWTRLQTVNVTPLQRVELYLNTLQVRADGEGWLWCRLCNNDSWWESFVMWWCYILLTVLLGPLAPFLGQWMFAMVWFNKFMRHLSHVCICSKQFRAKHRNHLFEPEVKFYLDLESIHDSTCIYTPLVPGKSHLLTSILTWANSHQTKNSLIQQDSDVRTSLSLTHTWWAGVVMSKARKTPEAAEKEGEFLCCN